MENVYVVNVIINMDECQNHVELYSNVNDADKAFRKYKKKVDNLFQQYDYIKTSKTKTSYQIATQDSSFAIVKITEQNIK